MFENSISPEEPKKPIVKNAAVDAIAQQRNLYTANEKSIWGSTRVYYADYQQKSEVMRSQDTRITTKLDDRQTVAAVLDLAQAKGWDRIKLQGTDSFRREAWVQAQVRGIEASGYKPKETDMQEAARRQKAAKPAAEPAKQAKPPGQQRAKEKGLWNAVEAKGQLAREQQGPQQPQRSSQVAA